MRYNFTNQTAQLVDTGANGMGAVLDPSLIPSFSYNGAVVAYETRDGSVASNDLNSADDVFVSNLAVTTPS